MSPSTSAPAVRSSTLTPAIVVLRLLDGAKCQVLQPALRYRRRTLPRLSARNSRRARGSSAASWPPPGPLRSDIARSGAGRARLPKFGTNARCVLAAAAVRGQAEGHGDRKPAMLTACDSRQNAAKQAALAMPSAPAPARPCNTIAMGRRNFLQARRDASLRTPFSFFPQKRNWNKKKIKRRGDPGEQGGAAAEREAGERWHLRRAWLAPQVCGR